VIRDRLAATGKRFYCICFTIRSGSSLLCEDLSQWGVGAPTEHFQFPDSPVLDVPLADHLVRIVEETRGEWFGTKMAWEQTYQLTSRLRAQGDDQVGFDLASVYPDVRFVHIVRRDKVGQAVSGWRAQASGTWHWPAGSTVDPGRPPYEYERIKERLLQALVEDWLWDDHLSGSPAPAMTVHYEDYVADRAGHLEAICSFLEADPVRTSLEERINVMRDGWTAEMVERTRSDLNAPPEPNWVHTTRGQR
jgi:LPS sulfotransferase NodH